MGFGPTIEGLEARRAIARHRAHDDIILGVLFYQARALGAFMGKSSPGQCSDKAIERYYPFDWFHFNPSG
jgi:hypothetical protein